MKINLQVNPEINFFNSNIEYLTESVRYFTLVNVQIPLASTVTADAYTEDRIEGENYARTFSATLYKVTGISADEEMICSTEKVEKSNFNLESASLPAFI